MRWDTHAGEARVEDHGCADGGAEGLAEQDLIVRVGDTGHHETKDVHEAADKQQRTRTVVVKNFAHDRAAEEHEEDCNEGEYG